MQYCLDWSHIHTIASDISDISDMDDDNSLSGSEDHHGGEGGNGKQSGKSAWDSITCGWGDLELTWFALTTSVNPHSIVSLILQRTCHT